MWSRIIARWVPGPLSHASVCVNGKKAYVYGGLKQNGESNGKLFTFDSVHEAWDIPKFKGTPPGPLDEHTAQIREDGKMFIFGGYDENGKLRNDVHSFNVNHNFWQEEELGQGPKPSPRAGHSSVLMKTLMYIFGGKGKESDKFNDLWILNTIDLNWQQVSFDDDFRNWMPDQRSGHSMFNFRGKIIVYGGMHRVLQEMGDLALFDPNKQKWTEVIENEKPLPYDKARFAYGVAPPLSPGKRGMSPTLKRSNSLTKSSMKERQTKTESPFFHM